MLNSPSWGWGDFHFCHFEALKYMRLLLKTVPAKHCRLQKLPSGIPAALAGVCHQAYNSKRFINFFKMLRV